LTDDIRTALAAVHKRIVMAASDIADGPVISNLRTAANYPMSVMFHANGVSLEAWFYQEGNGYLCARISRSGSTGNNDQITQFPILSDFPEAGGCVSRAVARFLESL